MSRKDILYASDASFPALFPWPPNLREQTAFPELRKSDSGRAVFSKKPRGQKPPLVMGTEPE